MNSSDEGKFTLCGKGVQVLAPACFIPSGDTYLLGLLNSKLVHFFLETIATKRRGGFIEHTPLYINKIPIIEDSENRTEEEKELIRKIRSAATERLNETNDEKQKALESQIDDYVCELYGLTEEEKKELINAGTVE